MNKCNKCNFKKYMSFLGYEFDFNTCIIDCTNENQKYTNYLFSDILNNTSINNCNMVLYTGNIEGNKTMKYTAIEFNDKSSKRVYGYIKTPKLFTGNWFSGYMKYLEDKKCSDISIYPLNVPFSHFDGLDYPKHMENDLTSDFESVLYNKEYYSNSNYTTSELIRIWVSENKK